MKRSEFSFCVLTTLECRADAVEGQMTLTDTGMKRAILETRDSLPVVRSPDFDFTLEGELGASPAARRRKRLEEQVGIASEEDRPICTETGFTACRILGRESQWEASREPVRGAIGIMSSLDSCGGCPGSPASVDCTELEGIADVTCDRGACKGEYRGRPTVEQLIGDCCS